MFATIKKFNSSNKFLPTTLIHKKTKKFKLEIKNLDYFEHRMTNVFLGKDIEMFVRSGSSFIAVDNHEATQL